MTKEEQILMLSKMPLSTFVINYRKMTKEEQKSLIENPYLNELSDENFGSLFLQIPDEDKIKLLNNKKIYDHVLNLPINKKEGKRDILFHLNNNVLKCIFESEDIKEYIDRVKQYIDESSKNQLQKIIGDINFSKIYMDLAFFSNPDSIYDALKVGDEKSDIVNQFYNKMKSEQINPIGLSKVTNYNQFLIYTKFNLLIDIEQDDKNIILHNGLVIPVSKIEKISEGKVNKIINLLKSKYCPIDSEELLEISLKLYSVFGYDNSKKIIEDKFTNLNELSLQRITNYKFKEIRREYRTSNQNEFYNHNMIHEIIKSLFEKNNEIFIVLSGTDDPIIIEKIRNEFSVIVRENNFDQSSLNDMIKDKINEIVSIRENNLKNKYYLSLRKNLKFNLDNKHILGKKELLNLLSNIDLVTAMVDYTDLELNEMQKLLLGNGKVDNDCLLRLIINDEASGLKLNNLVNKYKLLSSISKKNKLSLGSIVNIIDLMKLNCYSLKPNEMDISYATLSKIISSKEFCTMDDQEILKETFKLHLKRKEKVYSSIPNVEGNLNNVSYYVAPFDAEYLLSCGVESLNCFKISGYGEEFFKYCLTSNQACIVYLVDSEGKKYICPVIRSGNAINCNGIDPEPTIENRQYLINALIECFDKMIKKSYCQGRSHYENIEVATITNLHLEGYFDKKYQEYHIEKYIPIDSKCYSDYNKNDKKNYILTKSPTYNDNKYYLSKDKYYQKRSANYEYENLEAEDSKKFSIVINSIAYSTIDYKDISNEQKNSMKRKFKTIDISNFKYIVGNKDWYIAIDNQYNVVGNLLPYDHRAKTDYIAAYNMIPKLIEKMMEEKNNGKNR